MDDRELLPFFERMQAGFESVARGGTTVFHARVAGRPVRLRLTDPLTPLLRALSHLQEPSCVPGVEAELEIAVWDSCSSGWTPPPSPWKFTSPLDRGRIPGLNSERLSANFDVCCGALCLFDRVTRRALYWVHDARDVPDWELAAPFRVLWHWWSQTFGGQLAHGAAVGVSGRGVLLVGAGGSGKSSTAAACVDAGLDYVGDDYLLLTSDPEPCAHSLFQTAKIHTSFLKQAFPHWRDRVATHIGPERKSLVFVGEHAPQQMRRKLTLCGLVHPRVANLPHARLERTSRAQGLIDTAASTAAQLPDGGPATMSFLASLARRLPSHTLHLGRDLTSGPRVLQELVSPREIADAA